MSDDGAKNSYDEFERARTARFGETYVLKLYVAGMTPRSRAAIETLTRITSEHLAGRYQIEIIDILQHPERAAEEQLIVAPTLVKRLPPPLRKFIGDLSDEAVVLKGLGIKTR